MIPRNTTIPETSMTYSAGDELAAIDKSVLALIEDSVQQAKAAPLPTLADLTTDVYVNY